jgi:hypothetical protein
MICASVDGFISASRLMTVARRAVNARASSNRSGRGLDMKSFQMSVHAVARMAQRGIKNSDLDLIAHIGTEVDDGLLITERDYQKFEREQKQLLERARRICGKRFVICDGKLVTAYQASRRNNRRLLRNAPENDFYE